MTPFEFEPIGVAHTPYKEKFAIPRQPGLATAAKSYISLSGACNREEIVRGLEGFSHVWVIFVFHQAIRADWKPMVRPPRLGGNEKVGVFASRSPFRPNPIGLSAIELDGIEKVDGQWRIHLSGGDLLDQTPILDIKPYVPYADAIIDARGHFAAESPTTNPKIAFNDRASCQLDALKSRYPQLKQLIVQVLAQQPEPAYQQSTTREYGVALYDQNIRWHKEGDVMTVISVEPHLGNSSAIKTER